MALSEDVLKLQLDILASKTSDNPDMVFKKNATLNKGLNPDYFSGQHTKIVNALNQLADSSNKANTAVTSFMDKMNNILQASCESLTLEINELRDKAKNFVELEEEFMQLKKKEKEYEKEKSDILLANEKMKLDLEKEYREVLEKMKMEYEEIIKGLKSEIEIVKNEKNNIQINSQKEILDLEKLHTKL